MWDRLIVLTAGILVLAGCSTDDPGLTRSTVAPAVSGDPAVSGTRQVEAPSPAAVPAVVAGPAISSTTLVYTPPAQAPASAQAVFVRDDPRDTLQRVVARLRQPPFVLERVDEQAGWVTARFSGDPEAYLNCGWITADGPAGAGGAQGVVGARESASFPRVVRGRHYVAERRLRLDGRVAAAVQPEAGGTVASAETVYVVTKLVHTVDHAGTARGSRRETVSFRSGEQNRFDKGTVCQANGAVERMVLTSLGGERMADAPPILPPAAPATVAASTAWAANAPATVAPNVAAGSDMPVVALAPPIAEAEPPAAEERSRTIDSAEGFALCEARAAGVAPSRSTSPAAPEAIDRARALCELVEIADAQPNRGLHLSVSGGGSLAEGDELILTLAGVPDRSFLYISDVKHDGTVLHLPLQWLERPDQPLTYRTGDEVGPPFGRSMIIAVVSPTPLFPGLRPHRQSAADYAADLRRELESLGWRAAVTRTFISTRPG